MNNFDKENKKNNRRIFLMLIITSVSLVVAIVAASYAYFTATVTNRNNVTSTDVTTARLELEFTDGPEVTLDEAIPGAYLEKTFKVKNVGSGDAAYDVYLSDLINNASDKSDFVYTLTSNDGGYNVSTQTQIPSAPSKIVSNQVIAAGDEHNYTLRIDFLETNDNQDDNKGKTISGIIRINEVQDAQLDTLVSYLNSIAPIESSLITDETTDNNLRYVGSNPNNYVYFNNELWRIIGVMNNIETEGGQTQSLVKIRREQSLGDYSWDTSSSSDSNGNGGSGINQWGESTKEDGTPYEGSDLMRELNSDYLETVTVGTDGKWYSGWNNYKNTNMPSATISSLNQSMIETVAWNLGSPSNNAGSYDSNWESISAPTTYARERENTNGKVCSSGGNCSDNVNRTSSWTGKVGLFYASDYLYATSGGQTGRNTCLGLGINYGWSSSSANDCKNNNWLYDSSSYEWTMSPYSYSYGANYAFFVSGYIRSYNADSQRTVKPVVFLKSSVKRVNGDGTRSNPYTLT